MEASSRLITVFFSRGVMDESGEQFVAYCLPTEDTIQKRRRDATENVPYLDGDTYEYKMAREYNWNVKSKASKGYEENYFLVSWLKNCTKSFGY